MTQILGCRPCFNLAHFVQVSKGQRRTVTQASKRLDPGPFEQPDDREPGLYCAECGGSIEADLDAYGLRDDRLEFVSPSDFDAAQLADELVALVPRADWKRLEMPAQPARYAALQGELHRDLREALRRTGRHQLYTHQAAAIDHAVAGRNTVQATSAGSGKSLGLLMPVLNRLLVDPGATAIVVYPLRALANDQLSSLARLGIDEDPWVNGSALDLRLSDGHRPIRIARMDGATPDHERGEARKRARLLVTTPDSVHHVILRYATHAYKDGTRWARLLAGLRFVVLDEIHSYQGVFGSAVAQVLRRLRRMAAHHGAEPQFLAASATVGNPVQLAEQLTGVTPFQLVDDDGSPRRRRILLVCKPPGRPTASGAEDGSAGRIAPQTIAIDLAAGGALASEKHAPVRTITFGRSRNEVFQTTRRMQARLREVGRADLAAAVAPYAATFLAEDRAESEGKLRDGRTLAVVSTNALELGIDIPDLSLATLVSYPGQISSFRQRAGRVGRAGEGVVVLIVGDDPLQQFISRDPEILDGLLSQRAEDVVVSPGAPEIVRRFGLLPAQSEGELGAISPADTAFFGKAAVEGWSTGDGVTVLDGGSRWRRDTDEEAYQPLRNAAASATCTVYATAGRDRRPIGVIDLGSAPRDAFVPAIWTAAGGEAYRVIGFDDKRCEIYCEGPVDDDTTTRGIVVDQVIPAEVLEPVRTSGLSAYRYRRLTITRMVPSYRRQSFSGSEQTLQPTKQWPPSVFVTEGLHLTIDDQLLPAGVARDEAVKAFEHVLLAMAPMVVACDPFDLDATSNGNDVYLYDTFGGGIGLSRAAYHRFDEIVELGLLSTTTCPCDDGCPSCVMLSRRPDGNKGLSKAGAVAVLEALRQAGLR